MLAEWKGSDKDALPEIYTTIRKKFKNSYAKYAEYLFATSSFSDYDKFRNDYRKGKRFQNDPALK